MCHMYTAEAKVPLISATLNCPEIVLYAASLQVAGKPHDRARSEGSRTPAAPRRWM